MAKQERTRIPPAAEETVRVKNISSRVVAGIIPGGVADRPKRILRSAAMRARRPLLTTDVNTPMPEPYKSPTNNQGLLPLVQIVGLIRSSQTEEQVYARVADEDDRPEVAEAARQRIEEIRALNAGRPGDDLTFGDPSAESPPAEGSEDPNVPFRIQD